MSNIHFEIFKFMNEHGDKTQDVRKSVMPDIEKVIEGLETIKQFFGYGLPSTAEMFDSYYGILNDAIAMLKEKKAKPLRCKTCTMRDKTGFCHRWNREVKDDDYCSFGAWKGC